MSLLRFFQSPACLARRSAILTSGTGTSWRRLRTASNCYCHVNGQLCRIRVASVQEQSRENSVLDILPGDVASDVALEPELPARTQGYGSSSSCVCCPKASRDTAVRAAPSETVVPENVYAEFNPLVERSGVSEPDRPPSPHESVGSDDGAIVGLASNVHSTENLPMHTDHPEAASWRQQVPQDLRGPS